MDKYFKKQKELPLEERLKDPESVPDVGEKRIRKLAKLTDFPSYYLDSLLKNGQLKEAEENIQEYYEKEVQELLPKISEINITASRTGFDPITDFNELPFSHQDIIIAKPDRDLAGKCGTVYKVFDRETDNRKGMIRALKINKEDTVSGTKKLTDGDRGLHTPHIIRRENKTDIISGDIAYSLDWFDDSLYDYLGKGDNKKYFKNGLNIVEIDQFSKQLTQIMWEYHNTRKELCLDLKPENVMVNPNSVDEYPDLVYSDTGISTPIDRSKSKASRNSVGTEYIRSPKLFRDSADSDEKDDIFSVASNIYNLFTGEFLFQKEIDEERDLKNGSLDTFIDSLLDEREINRKVMDSVLDEKLKETKIPKPYQDVIRAGALGDYENTKELKNALIDAKEKYDSSGWFNGIKKVGKMLGYSLIPLGLAGMILVNLNHDKTGSWKQTFSNFKNAANAEQINLRNINSDEALVHKLSSGGKFIMIAEDKYTNVSDKELDYVKKNVIESRYSGRSSELITPESLFADNEGIALTTGENQTTLEFLINQFKTDKGGNRLHSEIISSILISLENIGLTIDQDIFKQYNSDDKDSFFKLPNHKYDIKNSYFNVDINESLRENYGKEDYTTPILIQKIRDYFTLNLARNYNKETGKIDMENFVVDALFGPEKLKDAIEISGETDFIDYTSSINGSDFLKIKQKMTESDIEKNPRGKELIINGDTTFANNDDWTLEGFRKYNEQEELSWKSIKESNYLTEEEEKEWEVIRENTKRMEEEGVTIIEKLRNASDNAKKVSDINHYFQKEINPATTINRVESGLSKVISEPIIYYKAGANYNEINRKTIPIFSTTDRIVMQYVLSNLQKDFDNEGIPYLAKHENDMEVILNRIIALHDPLMNGEVPEVSDAFANKIKDIKVMKQHLENYKMLGGREAFSLAGPENLPEISQVTLGWLNYQENTLTNPQAYKNWKNYEIPQGDLETLRKANIRNKEISDSLVVEALITRKENAKTLESITGTNGELDFVFERLDSLIQKYEEGALQSYNNTIKLIDDYKKDD